ncbi:MAG: RagB/SusD family nutrient uptake outer membrane protein [Rikenellaceae bacterium]|nr:RagB/SusD family nutrient uptake outer membrane protein [Rikenellaceae bacterium]
MKKYSLLLLILPLVLSSCENWLDVRPFDRLEVDKVFPDEKSTNAALNGLYVSMSNNDQYGKDMTCGALEVLALHFQVPASSSSSNISHEYYQLSSHAYTHEEAMKVLSRMFTASYKIIADANEFMYWVENGKDQYETRKYNQYMGEALGVRTYLHFDMLRLFGPMSDELTELSLPYYSVSSDTP